VVNAVTKEEFETRFAVNNGLFPRQLHFMGLRAVPCDCGAPDCEGWQMVSTAEDCHARRVLFLDGNLRDYKDRGSC